MIRTVNIVILLSIFASGCSSKQSDSQHPDSGGGKKTPQPPETPHNLLDKFPAFKKICTQPESTTQEVFQVVKTLLVEKDCLKTAAKLNNSKVLDLSGTEVTDLSAIYEFTSIEKIILNNNKKFKNLAPVVKSMTGLKSVELKKTGVSPIVFKEVSDKTPEVSIEFEPLWDANGLDVDGNRYFNGRDFEGYDSKGFLESGLHRNGSYFDDSHLTMTGERYYLGWDYEGYDLRGFLPSGLHRNGTYFGSDHLTLDGLRYYNGLDYQNNPPPAPPVDDNRSVLFTDYYATQSHVSKLTNSSGVCYLNAAMQVAFKMRAFNDYLIKPENIQLLNQSPLLQEYFMSMDMMKHNLTNSLENFTHLQADSFNDGFTIFSNILVHNQQFTLRLLQLYFL